MGRYYGLKNYTKKHYVSSYWKNQPPTIEELEHIGVIFGWDLLNDNITAYGILCVYDNAGKKWTDAVDTWGCGFFEDAEDESVSEKIPDFMQSEREEEFIKVGYNPGHDISEKQNVSRNINKYKSLFDDVFFCN